jgi:hypothetical protein
MDRKIVLWIVIGILFAAVLFITFNAGSGTSNVIANTANAAQGASAGMVGGC